MGCKIYGFIQSLGLSEVVMTTSVVYGRPMSWMHRGYIVRDVERCQYIVRASSSTAGYQGKSGRIFQHTLASGMSRCRCETAVGARGSCEVLVYACAVVSGRSCCICGLV